MRKNIKIGNFDIVSFIDPLSGKIHYKAKYKRKQVKVEIIKNRLANSLIGWRLILNDLKLIHDWCSIGKDLVQDKSKNAVILSSIFVSAITFYWKCFADESGRSGAKLTRSHVPVKFKEFHEFIKIMRHNFAAHAGDSGHQEGVCILVSDSNKKIRFDPFIIPITKSPQHGDHEFFTIFSELSCELMKVVDNKCEKINLKLNA